MKVLGYTTDGKYKLIKKVDLVLSPSDVIFGVDEWNTLWWWLVGTCVVHLIGFIVAVVFIGINWSWSVSTVTSFADWGRKNQTIDGCADGNCFVTPNFRETPGPRLDLSVLVAVFHLLSLSWQLFVLPPYGSVREFYRDELNNGRNALRWLEYSLSAPLMTVVIAVIFGVVDTHTLVLLAVCTSGLQAFGYVQELLLDKNCGVVGWRKYLPLVVGWLFFVGYWAVVAVVYATSITSSAETPSGDMTAVITVTFVVITVLFSGFAVVLIHDARTRGTPGYEYVNIEIAYCILSVFSKFALGMFLVWASNVRETTLKLDFIVQPPCARLNGTGASDL